jgi:glycosyltransferase involved in cell wall biosynthesis
VKVSIITVVYNGVETIRDCIESVLNQTYADLEYIVVDGKSTDGTVELVKSYGDRVSWFVSESDKGLYDAMNKGIGLATGEVIGFLNADDLYRHPDVVTHIVERLNQTGAEAVYSDMIYVDRTDLSKIKRYWYAGNYRHGDFLWGWMPGHLSFFARKRVYEQYGTFRLDLKSAADYELLLRFIHKNRILLAYLNETTIVMREGGVSNANLTNRVRANQEDRKAWELNGMKPYFFTLTLKPLRKLIQLIHRE